MQKQAENEYNTVTLSNTDKFPSKISGDWGKVNFWHSKYQPFNATTDMTCSMTKLPTNRESKQA